MSIQCIKGLFLKKWIIFQRVNAFCKAPFSEADTGDLLGTNNCQWQKKSQLALLPGHRRFMTFFTNLAAAAFWLAQSR